jgi:hypothetical protein
LGAILLVASANGRADEALRAEEALKIAQQSKEAAAFSDIFSGKYSRCISSEVMRSCDSEWVTCLEGGWVVAFSFDPVCGIAHDGRLSLTLVINAEGDIISRFPEEEYFRDARYCLQDYECLLGQEECLNFVFAPFDEKGSGEEGACQCRTNSCQIRS